MKSDTAQTTLAEDHVTHYGLLTEDARTLCQAGKPDDGPLITTSTWDYVTCDGCIAIHESHKAHTTPTLPTDIESVVKEIRERSATQYKFTRTWSWPSGAMKADIDTLLSIIDSLAKQEVE